MLFLAHQQGMKVGAGAVVVTPIMNATGIRRRRRRIGPSLYALLLGLVLSMPVQSEGLNDMHLVDSDNLGVMTIIGEAEGEPFEGKIGVGEVIRNRMQHRYFSDGTVAGTMLVEDQFSCWQDVSRKMAMLGNVNDDVLEEATQAWKASEYTNLTSKADHFFNPEHANPSWAKDMEPTTKIGNHLFLNSRKV